MNTIRFYTRILQNETTKEVSVGVQVQTFYSTGQKSLTVHECYIEKRAIGHATSAVVYTLLEGIPSEVRSTCQVEVITDLSLVDTYTNFDGWEKHSEKVWDTVREINKMKSECASVTVREPQDKDEKNQLEKARRSAERAMTSRSGNFRLDTQNAN